MKIRITTDRLPNKYPKGTIYEVETPVLKTLIQQGEAEIVQDGPVKKAIKKVVKKNKKK